MRKRIVNSPAFTLLELILALSIVALVLTSSYSALRLGLLSYGRLDNQALAYQNVRNSVYKMSKDLHNAFLLSYHNSIENKDYWIGLKGSKTEVTFITLIQSKDKKGNLYVEVVKAFYKYENKQLLKAYIKGKDVFNFSLKPEYEVFLANVKAAEFSYALAKSPESRTLIWKDAFNQDAKDKEEVLPVAFRISVIPDVKARPAFTVTKSIPLAS